MLLTVQLVDDIGLEIGGNSPKKTAILAELAQKLAQFDMGSLWKALSDSERIKLFAFAAGLPITTSQIPSCERSPSDC